MKITNIIGDDQFARATLISNDSELIFELSVGLAKMGIALSNQFGEILMKSNQDVLQADAILLDAASCQENTFALAETIRKTVGVGTVLLSQELKRDDRLHALSRGIDHVLHKPIDMEELVAILRNLTRFRLGDRLTRRRNDDGEIWAVDHQRWFLIAPQGKEIPLTRAEYQLLSILIENPGFQHTRQELNHALQYSETNNSRSLDVLISKLRRKVEVISNNPFPLRSIRGVGYVFVGAVNR